MKSNSLHLLIGVTVMSVATTIVSAQSVVGTNPLTGEGTPDGWTNVLYINEDQSFDVGGEGAVLTYTNFYAARPSGMYTPFVVEPLGDGEVGEDFIVRAIGTTRVGGEDYTCTGEFQFPFHDTETFAIEDGWLVGFLSSDPESLSLTASSPIPFVGADVEGWLTGSNAAGTGLPLLELGDTIVEGGSGTDIDAYGFRQYQFNISSVAGSTLPALDAGGKVGEACPGPGEAGDGVGAPLPLTDGSVDGWSGLPVMYGHQLPPGESVEVVRYYAATAREFGIEDELYQVTPVIVKQEDGSTESGEGIFSIWEVGPNHLTTDIEDNEFDWGSSVIPDDGNLYHPAVLQWQLDFDDTDGGVVAFADGVGQGMHYFNVDTTNFIPDEDIGEIEADYELPAAGHTSAFGGRGYQLNFQMSGGGGEPGDFNNDGALDAMDIDDLTQQSASGGNPADYDLTDDGAVNAEDVKFWVRDLKNSWIGDANVDGQFNTADLVQVLAAGTYEQDIDAVWSTGDFNGDGRTNTADLVAALADGGYENGPRVATSAVPEPSGLMLLLFGITAALRWARR